MRALRTPNAAGRVPMSNAQLPPPGWYPLKGAPTGTERYWDGEDWKGHAVDVRTGRRVSFSGDYVFATFKQRSAALFVDSILTMIPSVLYIVAVVLPALNLEVTTSEELVAQIEPYAFKLWAISTVTSALYFIGFVTASGATPGKVLLGIKVVKPTGRAPDLVSATGRWLAAAGIWAVVGFFGPGWTGWASTGVELLSVGLVMVEAERRAVWDFVANTRVVQA